MCEVKNCVCPVCGKGIKGLSDMKYCGKVCSNRFHEAKKKEDVSVVAYIGKALKSNRGILKRLLGNRPEISVNSEILAESGFDFGCYTSTETGVDGRMSKGCYDFAYSEDSESGKLIVRRNIL